MENQLKEIDLSDIFVIIKKEKKIIISLFFIGLVAGVVWFFIAPTKYSGTSIIEIGRRSELETDIFEGPLQVIERIKNKPFIAGVDISSSNPLSTNLVKFNAVNRDYDKVKMVLEEINNTILNEHSEIFEKKITALDKKEELLEKELNNLEEDISYFLLRGQQVAVFKLEIYNIQRLINNIENEKKNIINTRIIDKPVIEEIRPGYLTIVFSAFSGLFLGLVFAFLHKNFWRDKIV